MTHHPEERTAGLVAGLFEDQFRGVYVDVGAGYPIYYSNSRTFRYAGWKVIAIEPQPDMCRQFRRLGYPILQFACASEDLGEVDFEILDDTFGLAGSAFKVLDDHPREKIRVIKVEALRLDTLLARFHPDLDRIDVLDIDVEYYELDVLHGFDIQRWRPRVLVVENLPETPPWCNKRRAELHRYCEEHDYRLVVQAGWNEILMRGEDVT